MSRYWRREREVHNYEKCGTINEDGLLSGYEKTTVQCRCTIASWENRIRLITKIILTLDATMNDSKYDSNDQK